MRLGWLVDDPGYAGGAELAAERLRQAAPAWAELVPCPPGQLAADVDGYVLHNCTQYGIDSLPTLATRPVVKIIYDIWPHGDPALRRWLLEQARQIILVSPLLEDQLKWPIQTAVTSLPVPIDLVPYQQAAQHTHQRQGVIWLGRLFPGKGVEQALAWSAQHGVAVDFYGYGPLVPLVGAAYRGTLAPEQVPEVLARYERFLFLPDSYDACTRTVLEAWAAGCQLTVNRNTGALWWLEHQPKALTAIESQYWAVIKEVMMR